MSKTKGKAEENEHNESFTGKVSWWYIPEVIKPGMKVVDDELVFCSDKEKEDKNIEGDMRTLTIIQEVAIN